MLPKTLFPCELRCSMFAAELPTEETPCQLRDPMRFSAWLRLVAAHLADAAGQVGAREEGRLGDAPALDQQVHAAVQVAQQEPRHCRGGAHADLVHHLWLNTPRHITESTQTTYVPPYSSIFSRATMYYP